MFPEGSSKLVRLEVMTSRPDEAVADLAHQYDLRPVRVRARFCLFGDHDPGAEPPRCVVDTGAPVTILPRRVWSKYTEKINFLDRTTKIRGLGGSEIRAEYGVVDIWVFGERSPHASPIIKLKIVAKCAHDGVDPGSRDLPFTILGIGGGTIQRGGLCLNFAQDECYLVQL